MKKGQLFSRLIRTFRPRPIGAGFAADGQGIFRKAINDVLWYIVLYRVPECDPKDGITVQLEFCVLSPPLLFLTVRDVSEPHWGYSQIRATYSELTKNTWDRASSIDLYTEQGATDVAMFAADLVEKLGVTFLEGIDSTERILDLYRARHFSASMISPLRSEYEIAAWRGEIDPERLSFTAYRAIRGEAT